MQTAIEQYERCVHDLRAQMPGRVTARGDESYESARKVWNGAVDHYPAAIAFCENVDNVQAAVRTARAHDMPVSVRGRGHDFAGRSVRPDALVIDLSLMNHVHIEGQIATVAGGAPAGKVIAAAAERNLMAVTGWHGLPGMIGAATVGGYGPLIASHGLALDHLVGAELVLADGQRITVDQEQNPDLLWALKGGGGNFGVVTSVKVRLHRSSRSGWNDLVSMGRGRDRAAALCRGDGIRQYPSVRRYRNHFASRRQSRSVPGAGMDRRGIRWRNSH